MGIEPVSMAASFRKNFELHRNCLSSVVFKIRILGKMSATKEREEKKWPIPVTNVQPLRRRKTADELIQSGKPLTQRPP
jgi:hypothetical protein